MSHHWMSACEQLKRSKCPHPEQLATPSEASTDHEKNAERHLLPRPATQLPDVRRAWKPPARPSRDPIEGGRAVAH